MASAEAGAAASADPTIDFEGQTEIVPPDVGGISEFEAVLQWEALDWLIETAGAAADECRLTITDHALWIQSVDKSTTSMVTARYTLDAEAGDRATGACQIGVDTDRFADVLSTAHAHAARGDGTVTLSLDTGRIHVEAGRFSYRMAGIAPDQLRQVYDIERLRGVVTTVVNPDVQLLGSGIQSADLVGTTLTVACGDGFFSLNADGDTDKTETTVPTDGAEANGLETVWTESETDGIERAVFGVEYLKLIKSTLPTEGQVTIGFADAKPIFLTYEMLDGQGDVVWIVAPRVDR